jgi:hypothetical protein
MDKMPATFMVHNTKNWGQVLTAREMKKVWGGTGPKRKTICVICGPGDVHCGSVLASAQCEISDYIAAPPTEPGTSVSGWMGCKNGSEEGHSAFYYACPA